MNRLPCCSAPLNVNSEANKALIIIITIIIIIIIIRQKLYVLFLWSHTTHHIWGKFPLFFQPSSWPNCLASGTLQNSYFLSLPWDTPIHPGEMALLSSHALLIFSPGASKPRKSDDVKNNNEHGRTSERIVVIFNINNIKRMAAFPDDSGTWSQCSEATATPPFLGWLPLSPSLASCALAFY